VKSTLTRLQAGSLVWTLIVCAVAASVYSQTAAGGWALLVLASIAVWLAVPRIPSLLATARAPSPAVLSLVIVMVSTCLLLEPTLAGPRWRDWDYGAHHALTRILTRAFSQGAPMPQWVMSLSTGDAPFDLYPWITYVLAALGACALGGELHVPTVLSLLALAIHTGIALCVLHIARRFCSWPLALLAGGVVLLDPGSFETGVFQSMVEIGLIHSGLAELAGLIALAAAFGALRRPTRTSYGVMVTAAALSAALHPTGLLLIGLAVLALLVATLLAKDGRAMRAASIGLHLGLGCALSAFVWRSFGERHFLYGLHFAYPPQSAGTTLSDILAFRWPPTDFAAVYALGLIGLVAAFVTRRAEQLWAALIVVVALAGLPATPYLSLGLSNMGWFSRFQPWRLGMLSYPFIVALAAAGIAALSSGLSSLKRATRLRPWVMAALVAILAVGGVRAASEALDRQRRRLERIAATSVPDVEGFARLVAWAGVQAKRMTPQSYSRLFFEEGSHSVYHVTAETGLPTVYIGAGGGSTMLSHRMVDSTADSLRRFNVRWSMARGRSPWFGNPASERCFGSYCVREIDGWDGQLARIERGCGTVQATLLSDEQIEVQLAGTNRPALVALGFGSYPRWEASTGGRKLLVYSYPATPGSSARVLAAWLPPGTTHFTSHGALPSDRVGLPLTLCGALGLAGLAISGAVPRLRRRALRMLARLSRTLVARTPVLVAWLLPSAGTLLLLWGICQAHAPAKALTLGQILTGAARVEARRADGGWQSCSFSTLAGDFDCGASGRIGTSLAFVVRDHIASTPYPTPAIAFSPRHVGAEVRIHLTRRLDGEYVVQKWGDGKALLATSSGETLLFPRTPKVVVLAASAPSSLTLELRAHSAEPFGITAMRRDVLGYGSTGGLPDAPEHPPSLGVSLTDKPTTCP
jgi:hypothetical protein